MKIRITKGKIIKNKKGDIKKFITKNSSEYKGFGECYFSEIKKNTFKGWKKNKTTHQMISVILGKVEFHLIDDRKKKIREIKYILDEKKNYKKIIIPNNVWYAFKGIASKKSILFNFLNVEHKNTKTISKN